MRNYVPLCRSRLNVLFVRRDTTKDIDMSNKYHLEGAKIALRDAANKATMQLDDLRQSNQNNGNIKCQDEELKRVAGEVEELKRVAGQVANLKKIEDVINILDLYLKEDGVKNIQKGIPLGEKKFSSILFLRDVNRCKLNELLQGIDQLEFGTKYNSISYDPKRISSADEEYWENLDWHIADDEGIADPISESKSVNPGHMFSSYSVIALDSQKNIQIDSKTASQNSCCCQWLCSY